MELTTDNIGHRKFLKNKSFDTFRIGYRLPEEIFVNDDTKFSYDGIKDQCTVFFVMSSACAACDIETVETFISTYPLFHYVLFYETNDENFKEIQKRFKSIYVIKCEAGKLQDQLQFDLYPCVIGINGVKQVVACGLFNNVTTVKRILNPLLTVVYSE